MAKILFARAYFDIASEYLSTFGQILVDTAKQQGHEVMDLYSDQDTTQNFEEAMRTFNPDILIGMGHGNCYSEDTEILSENGWKRFSELADSEAVATLNPETNELEYHIPSQHFKYFYSGKMFHINGKRINLLVTPNHKLYASWMGNEGKNWLPFRFIEAQQIGQNGIARDYKGRFSSTGTTTGYCLRFVRTAKWNCDSPTQFCVPQISYEHKNQQGETVYHQIQKDVALEDWLRFFGVWLAEGSASLDGVKGHYIISIAQMDNAKRAIMKKYVDNIGKAIGFSAWEEASNEHSKAIKFKNKQVYTYLHKFGHAKDKYIPKEIKMLKPYLLQILLDAMVLGDGYTDKRGEIFYSTKSKRLIDDVQEIALKLGKAGIIWQDKRTGVYTIGITNGEAGVTKRRQHWVNYQGMVHCVEVPNHLVYVRRHGRPCWCGNSNVFTGQDLQPLLKVGINDDLLSGKIAYLESCLTGVELGPSLVEHTCQQFYGYTADFTFVFNNSYYEADNILKDPWATAFFDSGLATGHAILLGKAPMDVYNLTLERYQYWWDYWTKQEEPMADEILTWLNWDRTNFIAITPKGIYEKVVTQAGLPSLVLPVAAVSLAFLLLSK